MRSQIEFLTLLAFSQIECGRCDDAVAILKAIRVLDAGNIDASRLLSLAQLRVGDSQGCLETIEAHQRQFGVQDKHRQMQWLRIRALHASGEPELSRELLRQLRSNP